MQHTALQALLSEESLHHFQLERQSTMTLEEVLADVLEQEAEEGRRSSTYASHQHASTLATVLKWPVCLVYPDVNQQIRPFLNMTRYLFGQSIESCSPTDCVNVMWSTLQTPTDLLQFVRLSHFVALLPEAEEKTQKMAKGDAQLRKRRSSTLRGWLQPKKPSTKEGRAYKIDCADAVSSSKLSSVNETRPAAGAGTAGHRATGFDESWRKDFPWVLTSFNNSADTPLVEQEKGKKVTGMFCTLCRKHSRRPGHTPVGKTP